jgi:HPt (histidine-containing phosphotransfer) domain-containing protein
METPNLTYIEKLSGGDEAFKKKLIAIIKDEFPEEKAVYEKNIGIKNFKLLADNVHKLKHKISILGLEKSYDIAVAYEENLIEGNTKGKEDFDKILANITSFLTTL